MKDTRARRPRGAGPSPLGEYAAKRTFSATPEPAPAEPEPRAGPLLFVIQQHAASRMHYDLRLECDGVLKSWAVPKGPSPDPSEKRLAMQTEDHPFAYASFEGIIPPGQYGAGQMIVWDIGVYSPDEGQEYLFHDRDEAQRRFRDAQAGGKISIFLRGEKVKGSYALVRTSAGDRSWLLIKHKDRQAGAADLTSQNRSVLTSMTVEDLKILPARRGSVAGLVPSGPIETMPASLSPMLAEIGEKAFTDAGWMWEPKLDGYRALAFIGTEGVKLRSRRGLDLSPIFPRLTAELGKQAVSGMILDGEIVALDANGVPSFHALQNRAQLKTPREIEAADRSEQVVYYVFDLLHFAGINTRNAPYKERRRHLTQCLLPSPLVQLVHGWDDGEALHAAAVENGFEGVVGKRKDSLYQAGRRSASWLKVKSMLSAEFLIGGWTRGKGSREPLGSILVGYREGKELRYASHVGSGFDTGTLAEVKARLAPLKTGTCPFATEPELTAPTTWVRPEVVAEVKFQSWTPDGHLRAPVFLRLRDDVEPKKVRRPPARRSSKTEEPTDSGEGSGSAEIDEVLKQLDTGKAAFPLVVGPHQIRLTHLDRVYWPADEALGQPALTKRDLLRYVARASPFILPHLADRPLTMIRMPEGIRGERFFQKHWEQERPPFVGTIKVFSGHKDEQHDYLLCDNLPTLLWLAQSGTLEFHVWHSRAKPGPDAATRLTDYASSLEALEESVLNYPDYVVFDLDPYIYSGRESAGDEPELNTAAFEKGKEVAFRLRELLQTMSLEPIVKTSGKTGLHVFVPIRRTIDFDAARQVCEIVGRHLMRLHPADITMEWKVPKRTGKIFLDYNMNVRGKTLNVAYSPRGVPGAPVSMPLTWEELAGAHPLDFRIYNVARRLTETGDRWRNALKGKQSLEHITRR
ncbi:MAG: non-homologous end-joining DNA ligase [Candidatus Polarisedimenticolia bacterium]